MKATIESTSKIVILKADPLDLDSGVPARLWEGETESGIKVHCYITRIAIDANEPRANEFSAELEECRAPSVEVMNLPLSLIL